MGRLRHPTFWAMKVRQMWGTQGSWFPTLSPEKRRKDGARGVLVAYAPVHFRAELYAAGMAARLHWKGSASFSGGQLSGCIEDENHENDRAVRAKSE